ncbi:MAG: DbpA RNA binding domain-containing protein, partial [Muribaculaceae bacterium]|nr:DbpA RNA binding domain-containing protein [Muribaculaceae bacterium]
ALTTPQIKAEFSTLHFLAGRKEKLSKGDIAGFLSANSGLQPNEIGRIDLFDHYALAAIPHAKAKEVLARITPLKIKAKKVRITLLTL